MTMQYAYMQFTKDRNFLVDARELRYIEQIMDAEDRQRAAELSDTAPSEEKGDYRLAVVYGCYMPQADLNFPTNEKVRQVEEAVGFAMVTVQDAEVRYLTIEAVKVFDNPLISTCGHSKELHRSQNIGFAALVQIPKEMVIGSASTQAVSAFLRYKEQMDLMSNVLNRKGVFALKAEEKRIPKGITLTKENWLNYLDVNRALKTARDII